jgi:hypothetical protein
MKGAKRRPPREVGGLQVIGENATANRAWDQG